MAINVSKENVLAALDAYMEASGMFEHDTHSYHDQRHIHVRVRSKTNAYAKADIFISLNGEIDYVDANGSAPLKSIQPKNTFFSKPELIMLKRVLHQSLE